MEKLCIYCSTPTTARDGDKTVCPACQERNALIDKLQEQARTINQKQGCIDLLHSQIDRLQQEMREKRIAQCNRVQSLEEKIRELKAENTRLNNQLAFARMLATGDAEALQAAWEHIQETA